MAKKVDDDSNISNEDTGDDVYDTASYSDDYDDADQDEESDSFVARDNEQLYTNTAIYREVDESKGPETYKPGQYMRQIEVNDNTDEIVKAMDSDPYLFRIAVRNGQNLACLAEMTQILVKGEYSKKSKYQLFSAAITGIMANPNDPNYIYVEAQQQDQVELLASQSSLKRYILPFEHFYSRQPVLSKPTIIHQIRQVQRQFQGNVCNIVAKKEQQIIVNHFYVIKRFGYRNIYGGELCRVFEVKNDGIRVLTLARARSFDNAEVVEPHRFTKEFYQEENCAQEYVNQYTTESGCYYQGLLLLDLQPKNLREPVMGEREGVGAVGGIAQLTLEGEKRQKIQVLPPLQAGEIAIIAPDALLAENAHKEDLTGTVCNVLAENGQIVTVSANGKTMKIPRNSLAKYLKNGCEVRVTTGEFEGVVGRLTDVVEIDGKLIAEVLTEQFEELLDKNYRLQTDFLEQCDLPYAGFEQRKYNNIVFERFELVRMNSGVEAMITNLSFSKAKLRTADNAEKYESLQNLQPLSLKAPPIFKDGEMPPQSVSVQSRVRVKGTGQTGLVLALSQYQISYVLFIKIENRGNSEQLGIIAVDSKNVEVQDPGNYVMKKIDSRNEQWIGKRVIVKNPRYSGREGIIVGTEGDDFVKVRLSDMDVSVRRFEVEILEVKISQQEQRIGASQMQSQAQFGSEYSDLGASEYETQTRSEFDSQSELEGDQNVYDNEDDGWEDRDK